jgi:hypothetical protein
MRQHDTRFRFAMVVASVRRLPILPLMSERDEEE